MSNPYESPQPQQTAAEIEKPVGPVVIKRVSARPIDRLFKAKDLIGEQYWLFVGTALVAVLIGSAVPLGILMGPMMCGLFMCYRQRMDGHQTKFDKLFKGFDYFVPSLIATLIMVGIFMVVFVPCYVIMMVLIFGGAIAGKSDDAMLAMLPFIFLLEIVMVVAGMLIYVPFVFVYPLIVDRKLKALDAVKLSASAAWQNLWAVLAILFVNQLLSVIAACACYIPAFLLLPLTFGSIFQLYREVLPVSEKSLEMRDESV